MSSYQKVTLVGRLGSDPVMKYLDDGKAITEFSLAVNERGRPAKGKKRASQTTVWFEITCWEKLAETTAEHLSKGRQVLVEGKMKAPRPWIDRDGKALCSLNVSALDVKFLDSKHNDDLEDYQEDTEQETPATPTASFEDRTYKKVDDTYKEDDEDVEIEDVEIIPWQ
jgi:single-strand DNA-binding protein